VKNGEAVSDLIGSTSTLTTPSFPFSCLAYLLSEMHQKRKEEQKACLRAARKKKKTETDVARKAVPSALR
jgi:hypothetical protein